MSNKIVTIDGPAGSGKSTVAARLAAMLGWTFLDTGAMYRAATLAALLAGADLDDENALESLLRQRRIELAQPESPGAVWLDGREVTDEIRSRRVTENAWHIAGRDRLRGVLVEQQRRIARERDGLVTEGRDQGSVVFPDARWKFYLDADPRERARRRWEQIRETQPGTTLEQVLAEQEQRDQRDRERATGPLRVPPGAQVLDTTGMTLDEVIETLYARVREQA